MFPSAFVAFLFFLLGAIEELTHGDWGIFTPLAFGLLGLASLVVFLAAPHVPWTRRNP